MAQDHEGYIAALFASGGFHVTSEPLTLRSGKLSVVYFDHRRLPCEPDWREPWYEDMFDALKETFYRRPRILCNVDSSTSPGLTTILSFDGGYRRIVYWVESNREISIDTPHTIRKGDNLIVIDDVYTQGDKTATDVIATLRQQKELANLFATGKKIHLLVGLVRGDLETAVTELEQQGITLHWLITQDDVLKHRWDELTDNQKRFLREEFPGIEERLIASTRRSN